MPISICGVVSTSLGPLTNTNAQPVAHVGMLLKMGAKNNDMKKRKPVVIAVKPVRPPSAIPAPDSTNAVTGEQPKREPIEMHIASVQKATVERGKDPSLGSTTPAKRAIEYRVPVASRMSTYLGSLD